MDNNNMNTSSSDSSSPRGFPAHAALGDEPNLSLSSQAVYASWEQSDIRGDLASGWGDDVSRGSLGSAMGGMGSAARTIAKDINNNMEEDDQDDPWTWRLRDQAVHPIPAFYPMDPRSTRKLHISHEDRVQQEGGMEGVQQLLGNTSEVQSIQEISHRISTACQKLSIQGIWDNMCPSATLCTMERVEMEITVYLGENAPSQSSSQAILVELQRRKGCSVTFHNYRRHLLDAAEGKFNHENYNQTDGLDKPLGRDRTNQPKASLGRPGLARPSPSGGLSRPGLARPQISTGSRPSPARPGLAKPSPSEGMGGMSSIMRPSLTPLDGSDSLARPSLRSPSFSADDAAMPIAGLKTEGDEAAPKEDTSEKAMKALNMAASLIRKDRVDARRLGMESLVLLTDPLRAGIETAKIASRVVLLGTAREEMVWESNDVAVGLGGEGDDGIDALFDESSGLGIRETILEMIMSDGEEKKTSDEDSHASYLGIEKEFTDSLFNLCLTVLSNALHTIEESAKASSTDTQQAQDEQSDDGDRKPSPRRRAATEPAVRPASERGVSKKFLDETNSTFGVDVLSSLIRILGQAKTNPHDAYHSARCLGVLFKGCGNSHKARARRDLDAKRIVAAALEVGSRSHAKLEAASRAAMVALVTDDEESMEEEEVGERTQLASPRGREGTVVEVGEQQEQDETQCELPSVMEQSQSGDSDER